MSYLYIVDFFKFDHCGSPYRYKRNHGTRHGLSPWRI